MKKIKIKKYIIMSKLEKKIKLNTTLEILTGIHIGGSKENVEIGGLDSPVIKISTKKNQPYIPGSSLKGKIRCLLEQIEGKSLGNSKTVNNLFGFTDDESISKLIVRDAYLTNSSLKDLEDNENLDMLYTENKFENVIDRYTGTTVKGGIRQIERIPAGVSFDVEFVINVWDKDDENDLKNLLQKGMNALENDYLGGSGTRGYGQIKFGEIKYTEINESTNWK